MISSGFPYFEVFIYSLSYSGRCPFPRYCFGDIGELSFVLSLYKHSTFWVSCGYCFLCCSTTVGVVIVIILVIFILNGLLSQFFPFRIYFLPKLLCVYLRCLCYFLFLRADLSRVFLRKCYKYLNGTDKEEMSVPLFGYLALSRFRERT